MTELDYTEIFEMGPALQVILSKEMKVLAVSDAYLQSTLTQRDAVVGKYLFDIFPDIGADRVREGSAGIRTSVLRAIETKKPDYIPALRYDVKLPGKLNFEERYWASVNIPILDKDGEVLYVIRKVTDVTDNVKNEAKKKFAEMQMEKFFNLPDNLMSIAGSDGYFKKLNPSWKNVLGFSIDELLGQPFLSFVHPEDMKETKAVLENLDPNLTSLEYQNRWRCKDGKYKWLIWTSISVESMLYSVTRDITSLKLNEEALKNAVRARDEFLSIAGHEFKTPLTAIKLQTQLTKHIAVISGENDAFAPLRMKKFVDQVDRSVERLSRLVDDMLDISRVAHSKLNLHLERFDISEIVLDATERLRSVLAHQNYTLVCENEGPIIGLWDRFRIEQVITNLLTNAAKYGGGKPIVLSIKKEDEAAKISIKDSGRGIAPKDHDRIFQRFERAVSADEVSGLGLGLYIAQEIIQLHTGKIEVKSDVGQGAEFIVTLPIRQKI